jgi:hypothetical protein
MFVKYRSARFWKRRGRWCRCVVIVERQFVIQLVKFIGRTNADVQW